MIPEDAVNSGTSIDQVAAVSRTFKSNYTKIVKCQNCGIQHQVKECPALGKTCFSCRKTKENKFALDNIKNAILLWYLSAFSELYSGNKTT